MQPLWGQCLKSYMGNAPSPKQIFLKVTEALYEIEEISQLNKSKEKNINWTKTKNYVCLPHIQDNLLR